MKNLNEVGYGLLDDIQGNDVLMCQSVLNDGYVGSIDDAISEVADNFTEIYTKQLFDMAYTLYNNDLIEEVMNESDTTDIVKILQSAHYRYNSQVLYDNVEEMITNIAIRYINDSQSPVTEEELNEIGLDDLDSGATFDEITELVDEYVTTKIGDIIGDFNKDDFTETIIDGLKSQVMECDEHIIYDVERQLVEDVLNNNDLNYEDLSTYQLEDEFTDLLNEIIENIIVEMNMSEFFAVQISGVIEVYNTPNILVNELQQMIGKKITVEDMDEYIINALSTEYDKVNYDSIYEGDSELYIYDNKSYSYNLGEDISLNISWEVIEVNEDDMFQTIVEITTIETI